MRKRFSMLAVSFLTATGLHAVWLQYAASGLYRRAVPGYAADSMSWPLLLAAMGVFAIGLTIFVFEGSRRDDQWARALTLAALYGAVLFGFANLRNALQISGWQFGISVIDIVWGISLATATTALTRIAWEKIEGKLDERIRRNKTSR